MATKINTPISYSDHATLSVTTDVIAPYKYQWKRNGVNLAHGNNKSYTTPPLKPEDFIAKYSVQIFGQDKIEMSDEAVINDQVKAVAPITDKDKSFAGPKAIKIGSTTSKPLSAAFAPKAIKIGPVQKPVQKVGK